MRQARLCPRCGFLLRYEDPPVPTLAALRHVAVELLLWTALAFALAFLWGPSDVKEWYGALALAAFAAWLWQRPAQHARSAALLERRRYRCAQCKREYAGGELA